MDVPMWLTVLAIVSLTVAIGCALWMALDVVRRPQPMWIMNVVWPITALYLGPVAIWWYVRLARAMPAGKMQGHERHRAVSRPFWQTIIVEATHCGAGCTLGDVISESAIFVLGLQFFGSSLLTSYAGDFALAYLFGILFQYFAIAPMRGLSLWPGLWAAIQADTLSLIAFEIGLFAWMAYMATLPFASVLNPANVTFWFLMQIGMVIGYVTSYPANWILVRAGIKVPM